MHGCLFTERSDKIGKKCQQTGIITSENVPPMTKHTEISRVHGNRGKRFVNLQNVHGCSEIHNKHADEIGS